MDKLRAIQIEDAIAATLQRNRAYAPTRRQPSVSSRDAIRRIPCRPTRQNQIPDKLHNEIFGMFGSMAETDLSFDM